MTSSEISRKLKRLPGWKYLPLKRAISVEVKLKDFLTAVRLIRRIAAIAEKMEHHPDLHLTRYRRLKIVVSTHAAGKVTSKDFRLAAQILPLLQTPAQKTITEAR